MKNYDKPCWSDLEHLKAVQKSISEHPPPK